MYASFWGINWGDNGFIIVSKDKDCGLKQYVDVIEIEGSGNNTNNTNNGSYYVLMRDTYGDGWGDNVFGIKQN